MKLMLKNNCQKVDVWVTVKVHKVSKVEEKTKEYWLVRLKMFYAL